MCRTSAVPALLLVALAVPLTAGEPESNIAPFFITGDLTISAATEDEDSGYLESSLPTVVGSLITDYDPVGDVLTPAQGIAVIGSVIATPGYLSGVWQYYNPANDTWYTIPISTSDPEDVAEPNGPQAQAFLLPLTVSVEGVPTPVKVQFLPDFNFSGTATLIFRAWDGSGGTTAFTTVSTRNEVPFASSPFGGSPTAMSSETRHLRFTANAVNDAPPLSPDTTNLRSFAKRSSAPVKTLVADLMGYQQDVDSETLGLAIASSGYFACAYSLNGALGANDSGWIAFPSLGSSVLCLPQTAAIRVTPSGSDTSGSVAFTAYAWDGGGTLDADRLGVLADLQTGERISSGTASFFQPVTNTSPTWIDAPATLASIYIPDPDSDGSFESESPLSDLISAAFSDENADPAGIAIIGSTGSGTWSVSDDGYWDPLDNLTEDGGLPSSNDIVLVRDDQDIRYTPDPYAGSETATLTIRAWDRSGNPTDVTNQVVGESVSIGDSATGLRTISVDVTVNQAPSVDGLPDDALTSLRGSTTTVELTVSDEDPDGVTWDIGTPTGGTLASSSTATGGSYSLLFTPDSESSTGSVSFTVTDDDGLQSDYTLNFSIITNLPPIIGALPGTTTAIEGRPTGVDLTATDEGNVNELTWAVVDYVTTGGTATFSDASGPTARLLFTPDVEASTGSVTFTVTDDNDTQSIQQTVYFTVIPNETPVIVSTEPGSVAVAGQPWEALVTVTDDNPGDVDLLTVTPLPSETWISRQDLGGGRYRFHGTPPSSGLVDDFTTTFSDPSSASISQAFRITTVDGTAVAVTGPTLPVSTPGSVNYGAIHPGSASNLSGLSSQVVRLGRSQARAFWWSATAGGFGELPNMPGTPATAGIFLASLSTVTVSYDAPPQAAPYAIPLPAGSWSFIGIPPIYINASTVTQSHDWTDFRLETTAGVPVDTDTDVIDVLGTGTLASTRPWLWDAEARTYLQVNSLNTGTAYWVRNRSSTAYRLVRATSGAYATFGELVDLGQGTRVAAVTRTASSTASAADQPPAPPSSLSAPAASADSGGGSCGAGGLAGLLIAGLALIGLRPRRRN